MSCSRLAARPLEGNVGLKSSSWVCGRSLLKRR